MMRLSELKENRKCLDAIDWEMTPEEAVRLYLEWGNNWSGGNYVIRSANDVSHYFIVYNWDEEPVVYLVKRNSQGSEEIAEIELPNGLRRRFLASVGHNKGVYALEGEVREWLEHQLLN
jgi:hypothetical protein